MPRTARREEKRSASVSHALITYAHIHEQAMRQQTRADLEHAASPVPAPSSSSSDGQQQQQQKGVEELARALREHDAAVFRPPPPPLPPVVAQGVAAGPAAAAASAANMNRSVSFSSSSAQLGATPIGNSTSSGLLVPPRPPLATSVSMGARASSGGSSSQSALRQKIAQRYLPCVCLPIDDAGVP